MPSGLTSTVELTLHQALHQGQPSPTGIRRSHHTHWQESALRFLDSTPDPSCSTARSLCSTAAVCSTGCQQHLCVCRTAASFVARELKPGERIDLARAATRPADVCHVHDQLVRVRERAKQQFFAEEARQAGHPSSFGQDPPADAQERAHNLHQRSWGRRGRRRRRVGDHHQMRRARHLERPCPGRPKCKMVCLCRVDVRLAIVMAILTFCISALGCLWRGKKRKSIPECPAGRIPDT